MCTWQGDIKTDLLAWRQITYQHLDPRDLATAIKQRLGPSKSKHPHIVLPQLLLTASSQEYRDPVIQRQPARLLFVNSISNFLLLQV